MFVCVNLTKMAKCRAKQTSGTLKLIDSIILSLLVLPVVHGVAISDTVEVINGPVNVRFPEACSTPLAEKNDGELGTVLSGPTFCDGFNRWKIYWSDGIQGWSAEDFLQTVADDVSLPPMLISPGTITGPGPKISTLSPQMQWNASSGATGYGLYIRDIDTNILVYDNDFLPNSTSLALPDGVLECGHRYRWNMRAKNGMGFSEFSARLYFRTKDAIRIIQPNGGEVWPLGSVQKIRWRSPAEFAQPVRVELWRNGEYLATIRKHTLNDGRKPWTIPSNLEPGDGYVIRILDASDLATWDESNIDFSLSAGDVINRV